MKMITSSQFLLLSLLAIWFTWLACGRTTHPDEVQALQAMAKTLRKEGWDFNIDPCSGDPKWAVDQKENNVTCNCTMPNDNFCHVVKIILKSQSLQGMLPPELIRLPYLEHIDLTRNYLNGTIPREWGSSNLRRIDLLGNRLSGPIPVEITNIITLESLVLEANQFSGDLPQELGNLYNIQRLHLASNNFTGPLPETLARLTALTELTLSDNQFSGQIPDFIQGWTNLTVLKIQGSGLSGPIPSGISFLDKLTDLRISDLNGSGSTFPRVDNMTALQTLIVRSCNINGTLPPYLGNTTKLEELQILDVSFNKLSGVPADVDLNRLTYRYLTRNFFTGRVPNWTTGQNNNKNKYIDLSYNNFSNENPNQQCQETNVNLFASFSTSNNSGATDCPVKSSVCPTTINSLHINCGGEEINIEDKRYSADSDKAGPAISKANSEAKWAFSSTGHFLGNNTESYIQQNKTSLYMTDTRLYENARISPISLTYYGFCMENGDYTVRLHFAEIMFTDDNTYGSLGRRVFDIYIQGKQEVKDFNIANEASGFGKEIIRTFHAYVSNGTLEIQLYWAGKGTTSIPYNSVYGPLISAISVTRDSSGSSGISAGAVAGIVVAAVVVVVVILTVLWRRGCIGQKYSLAKELKSLDLQTGLFNLRQIKAATNNFDISNKIGEGGFGSVYKGILSDSTIIAVKQLSSKSKQGNREFINEIGMISALQHPCLVKLYGCCVERDQLLLVYEYMENNSLAHALFGSGESSLKLDWPTRQKICVGIARGLAFLHEESRLKIVHRDIKATNVLLDKDLNPKISDFGLAKLDEEDNTHISTRIAGTYGYMAPEYAMHGYLTDKADVYSFGIVALEIVSGKSNTIHRSKEAALYLLDWAHMLREKGDLMELVDGRLGSDFNEQEAMVMIKVAILCTNVTSNLRPTMSSVLSMLEGRSAVPEYVTDQSEVMDEVKMEAIRQYYNQIEVNKKNETESQSLSDGHGPWTASSSSAADLYPLHIDSSYWEKRN